MTEVRKRKLIEVALPLEAINAAGKAEKDRKVGKPQQVHHWWARRPIVVSRAVLFSQLVDDPSSRPDEFPTDEAQAAERKRLFDIIERLVVWENANNQALLDEARTEIWKSCDGTPPPILDPFAGGGSIPLEAQRLGLEAHASDLNPVAVLINKALIEIPPKWAGKPPLFPGAAESQIHSWPRATGLAEDVRRYGGWMRDQAEQRIGHLYPKVKLPDGSRASVIAWIWARTVRCRNPACRIPMPLVRSWWLSKKKGREAYVIPAVEGGRVVFTIGHDLRSAPTKSADGTVSRTGAVCIGCGDPVPLAYVRAEGKADRIGSQLMAIVAEGDRRRVYLPPNDEHAQAGEVPRPADVPETNLPEQALGFRVQGYGITRHADLYTNRQLTAMATYSDLVQEVRERILQDVTAADVPSGESLEAGGVGGGAYASAVATYLALAVSRLADWSNSLCRWENKGEVSQQLFGKQTISMVWDFSEANVIGHSSGSFDACVTNVTRALEKLSGAVPASVYQADASTAHRGNHSLCVATDPPYYDNIGYADLSDVFYVWLRRSVGHIFPNLFATLLTPKSAELVADPGRSGAESAQVFEDRFVEVFRRLGDAQAPEIPMTVVYAFKQSETDTVSGDVASTGWETMLEALIKAGLSVTATWPMRTEMSSRLRGMDSNALASSIVLACRARPETARTTDRRGLIAALRSQLPGALRELQQGSIAPVDLAQAAIGPGMGIFSSYAHVAEPDGSQMRVRTALALINQVLAEVLTEQEGDLDGDSRFALKWFEQHGWDEGQFGSAETLAKAMNTSVAGMERAGVLRARAGKVKLIAPEDLPDTYDPARDERVTVWEIVAHLLRRLEDRGVDAAAQFMVEAQAHVDMDAVKELGYLLYSICDKQGWAPQALRFNDLITSWSDLDRSARTVSASRPVQGAFDFGTDE
ncbi:DUF1156 domain-containing protein [Micromonospora aurantiaca (nom. illeg.)]|uniref:DUF1156 domain-containing protein n=1 Tax=Micromonospora aurantiaca (nom. illeg.) TaxID=47850 RepID=UPI001CA42170|nr:DUF1156 domain-containing protein [Micromonospora aurantiaca]